MARVWTESEDRLIRQHYGTLTNQDIASRIGNCIPLQVYRRAIKLGLQAEPDHKSKAERSSAKRPAAVRRVRTLVEPEYEAMQAIVDALVALDTEARVRVFRHVNQRLNILPTKSKPNFEQLPPLVQFNAEPDHD